VNVAEPPIAVLLPGTGSDDVFVRSVFEVPLAAVGVRAVTPAPMPGPKLAEAGLAALDACAEPVLVGGISFGAHLAVEWALRNPTRCAGVLLALPGWHGEPGDAPGAVSARLAASSVRSHGVEGALATAVDGVPDWLAQELTRSWRGYGPGLADSLDAAAGRPAPSQAEQAARAVPAGIAACVDDPVHPAEIAAEWAEALPRAVVRTTRLAIVGVDPEALGRAAVLAWLHAGGRPQPG
jgi:pimeloyl-ACP methyl ester carboxylesterase